MCLLSFKPASIPEQKESLQELGRMQLFPQNSTTSHQYYCLIIIKTYLSNFSLLVVGAIYCLRLALWSGQVLRLLSVCQNLSQNIKCSTVTIDMIFSL